MPARKSDPSLAHFLLQRLKEQEAAAANQATVHPSGWQENSESAEPDGKPVDVELPGPMVMQDDHPDWTWRRQEPPKGGATEFGL